MKLKLILPVLLVVSSCATKPLTPVEKAVRVLRKSDAPANCKELANVHAPGLASINDEGRIMDLRRATHKAGGNLVQVNRRDENSTIFGTAFSCPKK